MDWRNFLSFFVRCCESHVLGTHALPTFKAAAVVVAGLATYSVDDREEM